MIILKNISEYFTLNAICDITPKSPKGQAC